MPIRPVEACSDAHALPSRTTDKPSGNQGARVGVGFTAEETPTRPGSPIPDNRYRDFRDDEREGGVLPSLCRVIAGLVPAIHEHRRWRLWSWVPGTRPGTTTEWVAKLKTKSPLPAEPDTSRTRPGMTAAEKVRL